MLKITIFFVTFFSVFTVFVCTAPAQVDKKKEILDRLNQELRISFQNGNIDASLQTAIQISTASEEYYGINAYETGVAFENVGIIRQQKRKFKEALEALERSIECFAADDTRSKSKKLSVLSRIALIFFMTGDKREETALKSALDFAGRIYGFKAKQALTPTIDLARFYGRSNRINAAHELYLDAYEIVVRSIGVNSAEIEKIDDAVVCSEIMAKSTNSTEERAFWRERNLLLRDRMDGYDNLNSLVDFMFKSAYPTNTLVGDRGKVAVRVTIDETGKVSHAKAICEVSQLLGEIAEESIRRSKFRAKKVDGRATKATGFIIYNFN